MSSPSDSPYRFTSFLSFRSYRIKIWQNSEEVKFERGPFGSEKNRGDQEK